MDSTVILVLRTSLYN